ncbi:4-hydroxybenzoate polyprenyltransferase [Sinorhizobium kostiense]|uniref:4-hydroxybenzoate octaprenyltransferase n=1 Tax=Sinorhizobium kostiense TaxID=76747 RepID=A0ABS4QXQ9_9HYPH|nr:4-hydroxybenzoate octaprenyltransferase [Sinorhizobium kostiense]MBP2235434.1 4-hydroxybenzoate polyprenyltransferase [Sinorhizobium kostiense]
MNSSPVDSDRVHDAPSNNWVYSAVPRALWPYAQLARWDRPVGWQLLMWPCLWSAALAGGTAVSLGSFSPGRFLFHVFLFAAGAIAMRGAGCTYNDLVDHDIDMEVARTRSRPLPSGRVTRAQAKAFMILQALAGLLVLLQFNGFTIFLGLVSLTLVAIYPFAKRFTDWPQFFLGLAFSWGAIMGWAAEFATLSLAAVILYAAAIVWTIGYDTIYAYQDREDDALIGVRSTARRFGDSPRPWLIGLYALTVVLMLIAFLAAGAGFIAYLGLAVAAVMLAYQILALDIHDPLQCLALFKFNSVIGLVVFAGLALELLVRLA